MKKNAATSNRPPNAIPTLADILNALPSVAVSDTRRRDLRSAVMRVAALLGDDPGRIVLDLPKIGARLAAVNPAGAGLSVKRWSNIRSDFLAAIEASGLVTSRPKPVLSSAWAALLEQAHSQRIRIGRSRLARFASANGIEPSGVDDTVMDSFAASVAAHTLHRNPAGLCRQVSVIWNEAVKMHEGGLKAVTVAGGPIAKPRVDWAILSPTFRADVEDHLRWCRSADDFDPEARQRPLAPQTIHLRRNQIHTAVSALIASGVAPSAITALRDLVTPEAFKRILRHRIDNSADRDNAFNRDLAKALVQIGREWVHHDEGATAELQRLAGKVPGPAMGLTHKNRRFLRQFDDPLVMIRLIQLPARLWAEVKRDQAKNFRTLANAQVALAVGLQLYMPIRIQNLAALEFDRHLFLQEGRGAISTLELDAGDVKNEMPLGYDIPAPVARMLMDYRDRIVPSVIGRRPAGVFINVDGTLKTDDGLSDLISRVVKRRTGIVLTPHQFRHLGAKLILDDAPGSFEAVRQLLGHKNLKTTTNFYAGIDSRRAARHHQRLIEQALATRDRPGRRARPKNKQSKRRKNDRDGGDLT